MGILGKFTNFQNYRVMIDIAKISQSLEKHMKKRCRYCGVDLGTDTAVVWFVDHMADEHMDKIESKEIDRYKKIIKKVTG